MGYDHSIRSVRRRVVGSILRDSIVPAGVVALALRLAGIRLGYISGALLLPAAALFGMYLQSVYRDYVDAKESSRLGAVPVPQIKGKLPGNIDVLFRILAGKKSGYMFDTFTELFEECDSTTINMRILWMDKV